MASISSMVGSGWLFGAWKTARIAGPAALIAWPIGAFIIFLLAVTYAELGACYPSRGGMARYTQLSHGSFAGFISAWAGWISVIAIIPIEAISSVQYAHSWSWQWAKNLYSPVTLQLTSTGLLFAMALIVLFFLLNYWSLRLFMRFTIVLTAFKIIVPVLTCLALLMASLHNHTFSVTHGGRFMPYGIGSVLTAFSTGGIIFSFLGFQSVVNLSGEAKKPSRNVPLAIFISIAVVFLLYMLLQFVFIGAVSPKDLINGWANLNLASPYIHLAIALNLNWLIILIYLGAFASPSGTGVVYMATTSRMLYSMQHSGYMPAAVGRLHPKNHVPRAALWLNLLVSFIFLFLFRGWNSLVSVISVAIIIAFINGPVSAIVLCRKGDHAKEAGRKIDWLVLIAPLAFVISSLALYWACWPLTGEVILIIFAGLVIYGYYQHKQQWAEFKRDGKSGLWLIAYLATIAFISYIGTQTFGGRGYLNGLNSTIVVIIVSLLYYIWGIKSRNNSLASST